MPEIPATNPADEAKPATPGPVLAWKCHPARRSMPRTGLVILFLVLLFFFLVWYTGSPGFSVVLMVVMFLTLSAYWFPTRYTLTHEGVTVKTIVNTYERAWSLFRSYWPDKNGVLLSPFPYRSRLENFRGLFVRFEGNRDEVVAFVKRYVPEPEAEA